MAALLRSDFEHIVASMPQSAFVEAFLLLSPSHFIEPFKVIHKPIHPRGAYIKQYRPIQLVYDDFARNLSFIIRTRLTGSALGMAEYTHLLDCARSLGDATMADYVWHSMKQEHITPSLQCFNYYMDAKIWNMAYAGVQRHNMRINKYRYLKRTYQDAPGFEAYGTGPLSLRKVIRQLFNEMTEAGHDGNEASMINLMLASARVGDEPGVKNVLKTIWNVDVDALHAGIYDPVTEYDRSSPFYPTSHLLFAIANAFGTNNDIHSALSIVEHITNCYDIYISEAAWDELFTWSWVLSRHKDPGMEVEHDRVPCELSESLFEMITTEHNVEPTVEMHRKMAKTAFGKTDLTTYVHHMREAYKLLEKTREKGKAARKMVESYLEQLQHLDPGSQAATQILRSSGFAEAIHTYDILRHGAMQQTHIIEHLAKMMFTRISWTWYSAEWESILLPQLAEEWRDFIPDRISYSTMTGNRVYFKGRTCWETFNMLPQDALQIRRPSLADDFIVGQSSLEVKDDIIWAVWARRLSRHDLRSPLLMRIFEPWQETEDEETPMENFYAELNQENTEPSEENTEPIEEDGSFFWQRPLIQYDLDGAIEFSHQRKEDVFEWGFGSIEFVPVSQTTRQDPLEPGRQDPLEFNDQDPLELDSQDPLQLGSQ
ncbi:mitochondrial ATPase expression-domain-containing protein [Aspergillus californicus]